MTDKEELKLLSKTAREWALIEHENIELKAKVLELEKFIEDKMDTIAKEMMGDT